MDDELERTISLWRRGTCNRRQSLLVWDYLGKVVTTNMVRHYRTPQPTGYRYRNGQLVLIDQRKADVYHDRVLMLAEWLKAQRNYREDGVVKFGYPPTKGLLFTYSKNIAVFEVARRLRERGIAVPILEVRRKQLNLICFKEQVDRTGVSPEGKESLYAAAVDYLAALTNEHNKIEGNVTWKAMRTTK